MLNDRDFGGRNLTVNEARPKVSSGGFGGDGGYERWRQRPSPIRAALVDSML